MAQLKKRFSNNYSLQVSYTLAKATGNVVGQRRALSNFQVGNDLQPRSATKARRDFDNRHNLRSAARR